VKRLRIATYNVHRCQGLDRRTRIDRIADVIRSTKTDIVALQEVIGAGPGGEGQAETLGAALGMGWVMASTRKHRGHLFGNVVLSRLPIVHHTQYDLTWRQCEPRCCQRADVDVDGTTLHVYNVHLGTAVLERRYQARRLATFVNDQRVEGPKLVLGDFNEWLRGLTTATLSRMLQSVDIAAFLKRRRTYPGVFPLVHLDHIYYCGKIDVTDIELVRKPPALMASDHLPLVAEISLKPPPKKAN
jgi:endonuclease/exonuclease/phosphatase family metal-dependent hydrolase